MAFNPIQWTASKLSSGYRKGAERRAAAEARIEAATATFHADHDEAVNWLRKNRDPKVQPPEGMFSEEAFNQAKNTIVKEEKLIGKRVAAGTKNLGRMTLMEKVGHYGIVRTVGKPAVIGAGVVAGAAVLGGLVMKMRSDRKAASKIEAKADLAESQMPMDPMMDPAMVGQNTLMGMQPTPGDMAARVAQSRETAGVQRGA